MRTFIAIPVSAEVRARAAALIERLRGVGASVKWVEAVQLHFTLKFLGEVDDQATVEVCRRVSAAVTGVAPFRLAVRGAGAFPRLTRPRTIWLGVADGDVPMIALHESIERALVPMGFRREQRRFQPHLTIGRLRAGSPQTDRLATELGKNNDFDGAAMRVGEVVVMASFLARSGPTYQPLGRTALSGRA